jgi:ABC-type amino acid transport substrate-binding protein
MRKKLLFGLLVIFLLLVALDLGAQSGVPGKRYQGPYRGPLVRAGYLNLGVAEDPPGSMWKSESELDGLGGEVYMEIARRMGLKVRAIQVTWDSLVPAVVTKKVDSNAVVMWGTQKRFQQVNFAIPIGYEMRTIQQLKTTAYSKGEDLVGKTVASVIGNAEAPDYEKAGATIKWFKTPRLALMDVLNGNSDAAVMGAIAFGYESTRLPEVKEKMQQVAVEGDPGGAFAYPFHKDNLELLAAVNQILEDMRIDGTLYKIMDKYGLNTPIFKRPPGNVPWVSPESNKYVHATYTYDATGNIQQF